MRVRILILSLLVLVSGRPVAAQLDRKPRLVDRPEEIRIPSRADAQLILLTASAGPDGGDLRVFLDGVDQGLLGDHPIAPGHYALTLPLLPDSSRQLRRIRLTPVKGGLVLAPWERSAAVELQLKLQDRSGKAVPGVVRITSEDGRMLPSFPRGDASPFSGSACLCPNGRGSLLVPAGRSVEVVASAGIFRPLVRRRIKAPARGRIPLPFVFPTASVLEGATVIAPPAPKSVSPLRLGPVRKALGIQSVREALAVLPSNTVLTDPAAFERRIGSPEGLPPVLDFWGPHGLPERPRPLQTLRLSHGSFLYTNGPFLEIASVERIPERPKLAKVVLHCRPHPQGGPLSLVLRSDGRTLLRRSIPKKDETRISVTLPRGRLVVASLRGRSFEGDPLLSPPPLGFLRILIL